MEGIIVILILLLVGYGFGRAAELRHYKSCSSGKNCCNPSRRSRPKFRIRVCVHARRNWWQAMW